MPRSIRLINNPRLNHPYICLSCQSRLPTTASQPPQSQQKRWITRSHIIRIKEAMDDWAERADAIKNGKKQSMLSVLEERGFVNQIVGKREDLDHLLTERRVGAYVGVDPTAPSLHIGHLVPFMALGWFFIHGYSSVFLLGGTTAKFGDPTGRLSDRESIPPAQRKANIANMHLQLKRLGAHMETYAAKKGYTREWAWKREVANNSIWYQKLPLSEFLRVLGKGVRLGPLLGRDTVKNRMENGDGMSFADFSYPLLQAWDWWELFKRGTQIQIGGADQFGNILAGVEAIKAMKKVEAVHFESDASFQSHVGSKLTASLNKPASNSSNINEPIGFTVPLLTTSAGVKFGKSEGNAIWLDEEMTSNFDLYQFFLRSADADVERYLKLFTFLPITKIKSIMEEHGLDQSKRVAQHILAFEFVELIRGLGSAQDAQRQHKILFSKEISIDSLRQDVPVATPPSEMEEQEARPPGDWSNSLNKYAKPTTMETPGSVHMKLPRSLVVGQPITKVLWSAGLVSSRAEGQRLVANKGAHVGAKIGKDVATVEMTDHLAFTPIKHVETTNTEDLIVDGSLLILRVGKWKVKIIDVVSDEEYEASGLACPGWKEPDEAGREDWKEEAQKVAAFRTGKRQKRLERDTRPKGKRPDSGYSMERGEYSMERGDYSMGRGDYPMGIE